MGNLESARIFPNSHVSKLEDDVNYIKNYPVTNEKSREKNYTIVKSGQNELVLEALGDLIIVLEDKFKTGFECSKCQGECYEDVPCKYCNGTGKEGIGDEERLCRFCCPKYLLETGNVQPGKTLCNLCEGKGATLIAPDIAQRRPSSGKITSIGWDVKHVAVGDRVLYSQFAGTGINFKQKDAVRIMHEHEVMCKIYGTGKFGDIVK